MAKFLESSLFKEHRLEIEHYLSKLPDPRSYANFVDEYEAILTFIGNNPSVPVLEKLTGQQTHPFVKSGKYRIYFYSHVDSVTKEVTIFLAEIISNPTEKSMIYPRTLIPTYTLED